MSRIEAKRPRPHLFRDGAEYTASVLWGRLQRAHEIRHHAYVTPNGQVYMARATASQPAGVLDADRIGTYTPQTPTRVIEDDLLERLAELTKRKRA